MTTTFRVGHGFGAVEPALADPAVADDEDEGDDDGDEAEQSGGPVFLRCALCLGEGLVGAGEFALAGFCGWLTGADEAGAGFAAGAGDVWVCDADAA